MATTTTAITLEQYLEITHSPDVEYINGELKHRNVAVEILSPEDRYSDVSDKIRKYLDWGVKAVWIIDPETTMGQVWTAPYTCHTSDTLTVQDTPITLHLPALFASLKNS